MRSYNFYDPCVILNVLVRWDRKIVRFYDLDRDFENYGWGWVSGCCWVYFKFLGFFISCGFDYFSGFMGLICWRFRWRIGILNESLHVYLLRKCNKGKENIDYFNFLGNLHVLSQRTRYFFLPKIMKRKKIELLILTILYFFFTIKIKIEKLKYFCFYF